METRLNNSIIDLLLRKGVKIPCPQSVEVAPDVDPGRISGKNVVIHTGCKIMGSKTLIMDGVELGAAGPVSIENCQLGRNVQLKAGTFKGSTFLHRASFGLGGEVRECCLLEEGARAAHTVGLKQTILFPFVTLGSLINFCDCLMAGGTDEQKHSEVGSSYIHFNYTPNQDKATPSLIGDVPKGVMINQPPIFLGGQGGLVGPVRIAYGVVVAAGTIVRKDVIKENTIVLGSPAITKSMPFHRGLYSNIKRIIELNSLYIANLIALKKWYLNVRVEFLDSDPLEKELYQGAIDKIDGAIGERTKRLAQVASRMPESIKIYKKISGSKISEITINRKKEFHENWPRIQETFYRAREKSGDSQLLEKFLNIVTTGKDSGKKDYLSSIKGLSRPDASLGTAWLQGIVDDIVAKVWECLPSFKR